MAGNLSEVTDDNFQAEVIESADPRAGRLLGAMVRPLPRGGPGARGDRRGARGSADREARTSTITSRPPPAFQVLSIPTMILFKAASPSRQSSAPTPRRSSRPSSSPRSPASARRSRRSRSSRPSIVACSRVIHRGSAATRRRGGARPRASRPPGSRSCARRGVEQRRVAARASSIRSSIARPALLRARSGRRGRSRASGPRDAARRRSPAPARPRGRPRARRCSPQGPASSSEQVLGGERVLAAADRDRRARAAVAGHRTAAATRAGSSAAIALATSGICLPKRGPRRAVVGLHLVAAQLVGAGDEAHALHVQLVAHDVREPLDRRALGARRRRPPPRAAAGAP